MNYGEPPASEVPSLRGEKKSWRSLGELAVRYSWAINHGLFVRCCWSSMFGQIQSLKVESARFIEFTLAKRSWAATELPKSIALKRILFDKWHEYSPLDSLFTLGLEGGWSTVDRSRNTIPKIKRSLKICDRKLATYPIKPIEPTGC